VNETEFPPGRWNRGADLVILRRSFGKGHESKKCNCTAKRKDCTESEEIKTELNQLQSQLDRVINMPFLATHNFDNCICYVYKEWGSDCLFLIYFNTIAPISTKLGMIMDDTIEDIINT
jgi:hypothetical protein